jgi:hypothetical protein
MMLKDKINMKPSNIKLLQAIIIFTVIISAVFISGCEDEDWIDLLFSDSGNKSINANVVLVARVLNEGDKPMGDSNIYFASAKLPSGGDLGSNMERYAYSTGPGGSAEYSCSYRLEEGEAIYIAATTDAVDRNFKGGITSISFTIPYSEFKPDKSGSAIVAREVVLYKFENPTKLAEDALYDFFTTILDRPTPCPGPTLPPEVKPQKANGTIISYGSDKNTYTPGDNVSAFLNFKNTGSTKIDKIVLRGVAFTIDTDGNIKPFIYNGSVLKHEQIYQDVGVAPGGSRRLEFNAQLPSYAQVSGEFLLVVDVYADGVKIGQVSKPFKIDGLLPEDLSNTLINLF